VIPDNMERVSKVIGKLKLPEGTVSQEALACAAWAGAVGRKIAQHTRAARMVRSRLIVEVEDAVWQRQLFALREQIRRRIAESIGPGIVEELEFRITPVRLGPQRAERVVQGDEADGIADPILRNIYKASRQRGLA
jgi:predicted nucleic acid-binding Zn ribbon protein